METSRRPTKRLLVFDRRYGWVIDEWKDPSEEALAGGRGMFCVVPLAKAFFKAISQKASELGFGLPDAVQALLAHKLGYVNVVANSTINFLERPDILSPQVLQAKAANLNDQLQKVVSSTNKSGFDIVSFQKNSSCDWTRHAPSLHGETSESHTVES